MVQPMNPQSFEKIVIQVVLALPQKFRKKLDNVAIVIEQKPTHAHYQKAKIPPGNLLLGLYQGLPLTKRLFYSGVLPDKITLFQKPIEALAQNKTHLKKLVSQVLQHEIAHHFGFNEKQVRKWEQERKAKFDKE